MRAFILGGLGTLLASLTLAQEYGNPDRSQPGDAAIQDYLRRASERIHATFLERVDTAEGWRRARPQLKEEYFHMLGLWPLPERSPLHPTVTGTLEKADYVVELLHYQSRPGLYVTANLYRPAVTEDGARLPAVLYVCGHSGRGRDGNKTAFQSHGLWFARHGYVCLVVDTLQLGEIAALHHGTYREQRWWWHSRGYTPAGVECWNGIRGIDYLVSRADVDPERIAVTGISGGGAATFWVAAADERVAVAVPVSGMADLPSYVSNRVINGHCDCMFLYNTFQWPWTQIAALVGPRPLLFVNSDQDAIFPMDANQRVINRLESFYSLFGAGDRVDSVVSVGGHAYREDIRQAAFRFINTYLRNDPSAVTDSELDLVVRVGNGWEHPIDPKLLRVFKDDSDIPADQLNTRIDEYFVPVATVAPPDASSFKSWKDQLLAKLRQLSFRAWPDQANLEAPPLEPGVGEVSLKTQGGLTIRLHAAQSRRENPSRLLLVVTEPGQEDQEAEWLRTVVRPGDQVWWCDARGVGPNRWTTRNPPNYVERAHVLLGMTVDSGRAWELAAAARYLRGAYPEGPPVHVVGRRGAGIIGAAAALWEPTIDGIILLEPPAGHMDQEAPQFLNVLRVCDIPDYLGALAPRPLTIRGRTELDIDRIKTTYTAAGAPGKLVR